MRQLHKEDVPIMGVIRPNMKNGPWIAGGAPLQWYNGESVGLSDIDVSFKDQEQYDKFVKRFEPEESTKKTVLGIFEVSASSNKDPDFEVAFRTDNALSLVYKGKWKIQLIKRAFYDSPEDVINNFDFSVCQIVTDGHTNVFGPDTIKDIKHKNLRIVNMRPTVVKRLVKYMSYGYNPVPGTINDIIAIPDLNKVFKDLGEEYEF